MTPEEKLTDEEMKEALGVILGNIEPDRLRMLAKHYGFGYKYWLSNIDDNLVFKGEVFKEIKPKE